MTAAITTQIDIDASPAAVWRVLTDFAAYPQWNRFMPSIVGEPVVGSKLAVTVIPQGKPPITFRPTVQQAVVAKHFAWLGHLRFPGLFDGVHEFVLEPVGAGTRLIHRESFTGILTWLVLALIRKATEAGFHEMNRALKARAEIQEGGRG